MEELINFWRNLDLNNRPFIHPGDQDALMDINQLNVSFDEFVGNPDYLFGENEQIQTGLLPSPYTGNLKKASLFILMIKPGFHANDYYSEYNCTEFRNALMNNLKQENFDEDYPFLYLNPLFSHTSEGDYWLRKFKQVIGHLKNNIDGVSYEEILKLISKNVCALELFPYHSKNFRLSQKRMNNCASVGLVKNLIPELIRADKYIFCLRQPENWGVNENQNQNQVFVLPANQRRSASLRTIEGEIGLTISNILYGIYNK